MKAAVGSVVCLVIALSVFLLGAGTDRGQLFWLSLLALVVLSAVFALVALVVADRDTRAAGWRNLVIAVIALSILVVFVLAGVRACEAMLDAL